ncbi:histone-lysine n-methyltransferase setmar-like protein [Elysia marginata]|uniref:Histone-lysine n-methyltransferase setmar-like protein n=1 Tax=Elysia marginata TaxID=1093978 RepID=A0AAV4F5N5_9GAST|nr:histone-lysine n-methyltransferase setmar-like protein [Elysia marginata]
MILGNRRIKQKDIAKELEILKERVQHIIIYIPGYRNVSARSVPRMLTDDVKRQRKTTCAQLLKHYEEEGEEFIQRIVTGNESWVHCYDRESKRQSNGVQAQELSFSAEIQSCCLCQKSDADCFLGLRASCSYRISEKKEILLTQNGSNHDRSNVDTTTLGLRLPRGACGSQCVASLVPQCSTGIMSYSWCGLKGISRVAYLILIGHASSHPLDDGVATVECGHR